MSQPIKRILIGIALFFLGGFVIPSIVWFSIFIHLSMAAPEAEFIIPDAVEVLIEKPGKYYVWNHYQAVFEGRTYSTAQELPGGIEITLHPKENNRSLAFHGDLSASSQAGDSHKNSVGYFLVDEPGVYVLNVSGASEPRVFSFGKSFFTAKTVAVILAIGFSYMAAALAGLVFIVVGVVGLCKTKKTTEGAQLLSGQHTAF